MSTNIASVSQDRYSRAISLPSEQSPKVSSVLLESLPRASESSSGMHTRTYSPQNFSNLIDAEIFNKGLSLSNTSRSNSPEQTKQSFFEIKQLSIFQCGLTPSNQIKIISILKEIFNLPLFRPHVKNSVFRPTLKDSLSASLSAEGSQCRQNLIEEIKKIIKGYDNDSEIEMLCLELFLNNQGNLGIQFWMLANDPYDEMYNGKTYFLCDSLIDQNLLDEAEFLWTSTANPELINYKFQTGQLCQSFLEKDKFECIFKLLKNISKIDKDDFLYHGWKTLCEGLLRKGQEKLVIEIL